MKKKKIRKGGGKGLDRRGVFERRKRLPLLRRVNQEGGTPPWMGKEKGGESSLSTKGAEGKKKGDGLGQ